MEKCQKCALPLSDDEIALSKKLINRAGSSLLCIDCMSVHFNVSRELLEGKIKEFKSLGCTLFTESKE